MIAFVACLCALLLVASLGQATQLSAQPTAGVQPVASALAPAPTMGIQRQHRIVAPDAKKDKHDIPQAIGLAQPYGNQNLKGSGLQLVYAIGGALAAMAMAASHMWRRSRSVMTPLEMAGVQVHSRKLAMAAFSSESEPSRTALLPKKKDNRRWSKLLGAALAVTLTAGLLLAPIMPAEAAQSGGRMGGSSFSAARAVRPPSGGAMYQAPSVRSGGTVVMAPSYGMNSFFFPMTYGFGGYGGYSMYYGGGFGIFNMVFLLTIVYFAFNFMQNMFGGTAADDGYDDYDDPLGSVVKLQVGLLGVARGLQKDLDRIAERADTDSPEGLHFVLQETVLALLRNPDYCFYGFSEGMQGLTLDRTEDYFNSESLGERSKFKNETLMNFGGVTKKSANGQASGNANELIVVTLLVAVTGKLKLPPVNDAGTLREALKKLGGISRDDVLAVEVLWTPQEEGDTFTQEEVVRDYPLLNRL